MATAPNIVIVDKRGFLLPRMEFVPLEGETGFYVKELGGKGLLEFREAVEKLHKSAGNEVSHLQAIDLMVAFIILSACDADGNPIFTEADAPLLANKNPNLLLTIANVAMPLSGINPATFSEVAVDLKNAQRASSSTGSRKNSRKRLRK